MEPRLWIGTAFAAVLVLFLMIAFFFAKQIGQGQWAILRFLCALCAGAAGAFFTGEAFFKLTGSISQGTDLAVSGTAGVALFLVVFYGFAKFVDKPPDAYNITIAAGWTLQQAANAIASEDGSLARFTGFRPDELAAPLQPRQLKVTTPEQALTHLRELATSPVRPYSVTRSQPHYELTIL